MERLIVGDLNPAPRILMGPGPSNVHYRVYQAMSTPVIGYLDPQLLACMDVISEMFERPFPDEEPPYSCHFGNGEFGDGGVLR